MGLIIVKEACRLKARFLNVYSGMVARALQLAYEVDNVGMSRYGSECRVGKIGIDVKQK